LKPTKSRSGFASHGTRRTGRSGPAAARGQAERVRARCECPTALGPHRDCAWWAGLDWSESRGPLWTSTSASTMSWVRPAGVSFGGDGAQPGAARRPLPGAGFWARPVASRPLRGRSVPNPCCEPWAPPRAVWAGQRAAHRALVYATADLAAREAAVKSRTRRCQERGRPRLAV